jgi:hypothetical protein
MTESILHSQTGNSQTQNETHYQTTTHEVRFAIAPALSIESKQSEQIAAKMMYLVKISGQTFFPKSGHSPFLSFLVQCWSMIDANPKLIEGFRQEIPARMLA